MDRGTLNDLIYSKLPALFGCDGLLPLAADCYSAPASPADPVVAAASSMAESAAAAVESATDAHVQLNATDAPHPAHPYYPLGAEIVGYLENEFSVIQLLAIFGAGCTLLFLATYLVARRARPSLRTSELLTVMWFVLCGCLHVFFEGYYVYNFARLGGSQHIFGQLWKEYALGDSRYLTKQTFVLCMESITVVCWGPLSFITARMIVNDHPFRYSFQALVSLAHLYGDVLYYVTAAVDHAMLNLSYSRPEAYYYWGYFVLMNAFWIVVPFLLICQSVRASGRAFKALAKMERTIGLHKKTMSM